MCVNSVSANLIASAHLVYALRRHTPKLITWKRTVSEDENLIMELFMSLEPPFRWKFETLLKFSASPSTNCSRSEVSSFNFTLAVGSTGCPLSIENPHKSWFLETDLVLLRKSWNFSDKDGKLLIFLVDEIHQLPLKSILFLEILDFCQ